MAAHKASPLQLSSELEREPNQLVRAHSTPQRLAARARIIMVASAGPGIDETVRQLGIWRKAAGYWRRRRLNAGVSAGVAARLSDAPRLRAPDAVCQITALACEDPEALGDPDQSLEPKRTGPTIRGPLHRQQHLARLCRAFSKQKADLEPHCNSYWLTAKPDPDFETKCANICAGYQAAPIAAEQGVQTVSMDEMIGIQALERAAPS